MHHLSLENESEVTLEPTLPAIASVVLLHGLGADGWDFVPIVEELRLPDALPVRFVFPHAPLRPVTVNAGYVMRAWYDITSFTPEGRADAAGLAESVERVNGYLEQEAARGIPASRIVLAGFSQGGAVALSRACGSASDWRACWRSPPTSPSLPASRPRNQRRTPTCRS